MFLGEDFYGIQFKRGYRINRITVGYNVVNGIERWNKEANYCSLFNASEFIQKLVAKYYNQIERNQHICQRPRRRWRQCPAAYKFLKFFLCAFLYNEHIQEVIIDTVRIIMSLSLFSPSLFSKSHHYIHSHNVVMALSQPQRYQNHDTNFRFVEKNMRVHLQRSFHFRTIWSGTKFWHQNS